MNGNRTSLRRRLAENLKLVRERIVEASQRSRRDPAEVTLVAVTKTVGVDVIRQALELGLTDLGESRAQSLSQRAAMLHEYYARRSALGGATGEPLAPRPRWHMIGHLQRNKVKLVAPWADLVHSVDSLRVAEAIHAHALESDRTVAVLLQVNTSGERSKFGVAVAAAPYLVEQLLSLPRLRLRGLMTMAPLHDPPAMIRQAFERLREIFDDLRREAGVGPQFDQLSMGMSNDYPLAIEAGATLIRLGHALFDGIEPPAAEAAAAAESAEEQC